MQTQPKMEKEIDIISFEKAPVEAKKCSPNRTFCLPFPPEEYAERFNRVRKAMQKAKVDVAISTAHRDFHWLTGNKVDFWAAESPQWIIISDQEAIGVVRHLEASTHRMCSYLKDWVEYPDAGPINPYDPVGYTVATLKKLGLHKGRIGMNFRVVSLEEFHRFDQLLPEAELVDFRVEKVRSRRSPLELDCLRKAATVNQKAIMDTVQKLQVGWSEWRILKELNR
ncbi:MAG: hypothetical protein GWM98_03885, partial [Nitrospinaceae bacterium]|nr:hypothetical protein [Nitrospinaceae bacterium]NIR53805.1 hypothetical protein [Nitrospinaceae bacterium]NIS84216.1 hypothetical protein [Nitrospinaceae bacterium]NIT81022.1 hypothetical protein [Nitrospinaceae bacterium]NIU43311.1 hypothetical protein [Nitrospinaceae bacterium]